MRCFNCGGFTLGGFCEFCLKELSEFSLGFREFDGGFRVYYFYKFDEIRHLIYSKHKFYGFFVFNMLARLSFAKFKSFFNPSLAELNNQKITALPLDDSVTKGLYSHSAILAKSLKSQSIMPKFGALRAMSAVKYSGKSLAFRKKNKRNFKLLKPINSPVILIDDVITTGLSMQEAKMLLEKNQIRVLFGLVLADAKD